MVFEREDPFDQMTDEFEAFPVKHNDPLDKKLVEQMLSKAINTAKKEMKVMKIEKEYPSYEKNHHKHWTEKRYKNLNLIPVSYTHLTLPTIYSV